MISKSLKLFLKRERVNNVFHIAKRIIYHLIYRSREDILNPPFLSVFGDNRTRGFEPRLSLALST